MPAINLEPISRQVEQYMMDEVTVYRPQPSTLDDGTLLLTKTWIEIYVGKGFIVPEGTPYPHNLGGGQYSDTRFEIAIPAASEVVLPNDEVLCRVSYYNPGMMGMVFIVVGEVESTFFTHRRLTCYKEQDAQ